MLGALLPWNWGATDPTTHHHPHHSRHRRRHAHREADPDEDLNELDVRGGSYPGLVNISGTYCFMNSTLQASMCLMHAKAMASLAYLNPHLDAIHSRAVVLDVPSPVVDTLRSLLHKLNTPHSRSGALRPADMIDALSQRAAGKSNSLMGSREHQDAQELFQLLSECIKEEINSVDKEGLRDRGLGTFAQWSSPRELGKSVFDGLTANRRSCVVCGYTEAVMHFPFDSWQLALPSTYDLVDLDVLLQDYTRLEILNDCVCRKCSLVATHKRLLQDLADLAEATRPEANPSNSKRRRFKEVKKMEARVREALSDGRIEEDLKDVRMEKVFSKVSTKQAMIARPPPVLVLHLNRSMHHSYGGASKNPIRVRFQEILDLTPYTTSGNLSTVPTQAISVPASHSPLSRSTTPTPSTYASTRTLYRLSSVVCHFGAHSFGHYICYRRKPRGDRLLLPKAKHVAVSSVIAGYSQDAADYEWEGQPDFESEAGAGSGRGWLRISDTTVGECGIETVLQEQRSAFMLYYERVVLPRPTPPRSQSEETLKPRAEASVPVMNGYAQPEQAQQAVPRMSRSSSSARVVRSVAAGRGRSRSERSASVSVKDYTASAVSGRDSPSLHLLNGDDSKRANGNAMANGDAHIASSRHDRNAQETLLPNGELPTLGTCDRVSHSSALSSSGSLENRNALTPSQSSVLSPQPKHYTPPDLVELRA
ncbi:cysteine proteinase [Fistulina hepatica ATCC 64428]|uniref:ubiquitinyl hydrolase 1 n=1 Tax=Fistulina hepatica ATCC 64428 TaxID=1128425 RepID=A0A0D7AIF7_9AGAR|nr:cysteine proteinase [Fistulina hepatica ATCC 64428]